MKRISGWLVLLFVSGSAWAQVTAFRIEGPTVNLAVTSTTGRVQFQTANNSPQMRLYNAGTVAVFVACGDNTVVATAAAGVPIAPGTVEVLGCAQPYVAAITTTTATLYVTPGNGL
jgi:hypothetical protein